MCIFKYYHNLLCLLFLFLAAGCFKAPAPVKHSPEANQKFLQFCKKEYNLNVVTQKLNRTLWIYVPIENPIIDYKGTKEGPQHSNIGTEKLSLQYIDGHFANGTFYLEYVVAKIMNYPLDYGYKSSYSEEYQKIQNHLLTALYRSYADVEDSSDEKAPEFMMLIVADVKKGLELTSLFYLEDFKRAQIGSLPTEEFIKRNISELRGQESIIGDTVGLHVDYQDITWPEFLTKQILNRIRFKYQQSDFKPSEDTVEEIITIAAQTFQGYHFSDFKSVQLNDLATGKMIIFEQSKLAAFAR